MKRHVVFGSLFMLTASCGGYDPEFDDDASRERAEALTLPPSAAPQAVQATDTLVCDGPPGLYAEGSCSKLAEGVRPYEPAYPLWSDAAAKERFIYLPPDSKIDTSNPDRWSFPKGTRLYKTFSVEGQRIETRLIEKVADAIGTASWQFTAYAWDEAQRRVAPASPDGVKDALGTHHDIPSQADCLSCHRQSGDVDAINGFSALQLNHPPRDTRRGPEARNSRGYGQDLTLQSLLREDLLANSGGEAANVSLENSHFVGDEPTQDALGYLHANCGHCHGGSKPILGLSLWSTVGSEALSDTPVLQTAVCRALLGRWKPAPYVLRIAPGSSQTSGIIGRMSLRGSSQMPPRGTEFIDPDGLLAVSSFIDTLPADLCDSL